MAAALLTGFSEIKRRLSEIPPFTIGGGANGGVSTGMRCYKLYYFTDHI